MPVNFNRIRAAGMAAALVGLGAGALRAEGDTASDDPPVQVADAGTSSAAATTTGSGEDVAASPSFWSRFTPTLNLRARYEYGDQDGKDDAAAWTLRGRLGLRAQISESVTAFGEFEHTRTANRQGYQAASVHGLGQNKVVIADPETFELNQLWLGYENDDLAAKVGIQRVIVENARFVGNVGWRQNEQTFDGATLAYTGVEGLELRYGYFYNVRRIFGSETREALGQRDFDSRSHFVTAGYSPDPAAKLTAYGYFLDLENSAGSAASSNTVGASLTGAVPAGSANLAYRLEYATQSDAADSPRDYRAHYLHAHLSTALAPLTVGAGYEVLGAGDGVGFDTPLATLHAFNGFADIFLNTPATGLRDFYVEAGTQLPFGFTAKAVYHDFTAEDDSTDLGYEFDFVLAKPLPMGMKALFKAALYQAEEGGFVDTERYILQLEYAHN